MSSKHKHKKNLIVSYKNLPDEVKELFKEVYPDGYSNHLQKFVKPNGEPIFVVPLETDDTAYMIKFEVKIDTLGDDDADDKDNFDDEAVESKEIEFAPLSEAIENEEGDTRHKQRVLMHGSYDDLIEEQSGRKKKITLGINKEEIKAALGEDDEEADELDSYDKIDDDEPDDDDFEPSDDDLRGIEEEYLDAEIPPLDATIPDDDDEAPKKPAAKKRATKTAATKVAKAPKVSPAKAPSAKAPKATPAKAGKATKTTKKKTK